MSAAECAASLASHGTFRRRCQGLCPFKDRDGVPWRRPDRGVLPRRGVGSARRGREGLARGGAMARPRACGGCAFERSRMPHAGSRRPGLPGSLSGLRLSRRRPALAGGRSAPDVPECGRGGDPRVDRTRAGVGRRRPGRARDDDRRGRDGHRRGRRDVARPGFLQREAGRAVGRDRAGHLLHRRVAGAGCDHGGRSGGRCSRRRLASEFALRCWRRVPAPGGRVVVSAASRGDRQARAGRCAGSRASCGGLP
jgi:hypothetical protein